MLYTYGPLANGGDYRYLLSKHMRSIRILLVAVLLSLPMTYHAQTPSTLAAAWEKDHISRHFPSDIRHSDVKKYIEEIAAMGIRTEQVGRSFGGREIYQMEWGSGPLKVFMWSQMHGDETTATPALIDMFAYLQKHREIDWVREIGEKMTIRAVPMLNPDGAELFQRRNLQGIDINRDAQNLATPEARLLKRLRDEWSPAIGFNLHNQNDLTLAGRGTKQATISFLVVFGDAQKTRTPGHLRNEKVVASMITALREFIPGNIGRYADEWTPSAFGDNFGAWGTPAILIETGGLFGKDEKFLVNLNFVAFLTALHTIAAGRENNYDPELYRTLPENAFGNVAHLVFRGGTIVNRAATTTIAQGDIPIIYERRRASFVPTGRIAAISFPSPIRGFIEYDARDYFVVHRFGITRLGEIGEFNFYKKSRSIQWDSDDFDRKFPPDAVFAGGKWIKGEGLVPKLTK